MRSSGLHLGLGLFEECADAPDDLGGAVAVADDAFGGEVGLEQIRRLGEEPAAAGMGVGDDRGQRLVDLMRDGGGELADGGDLRGAGETRLGQAQDLEGIPAILDVGQQPVPAEDAALLVEERLAEHVEPAVGAVGAAHAVIHLVAGAGCDCPDPGAERGFHIVGVKEVGPPVPHQVADGNAEVVDDALIDRLQGSIGKGGPDECGDGVDDQTKAALALEEGLLGALAVFDVGVGSVPLDDVAGLIAERSAAEEKPAVLAVGAAHSCFDLARLSAGEGGAPGSRRCSMSSSWMRVFQPNRAPDRW